MGSQRDRGDGALLHSARHRPADRWTWSRTDHSRVSLSSPIVFESETHSCAPHQLLAVHTFVTALWKVGLEARSVALGLVFVACAYIALWVGIGAGHLKNYEAPVPVRYSILFFPALLVATDTTRVSIGAGSALITRANVSVVNMSGCGWHYSLR